MSVETFIGRRGKPVNIHGYGGYSMGCRCDTCKEAKREYMRERRSYANKRPRRLPDRPMAPIQRHGTAFGYEERGCRCHRCTAAHLARPR